MLFPTCTSVPSTQPQRRGFERRRIPALAVAQDDRFRAAVDDADEQPLGRRPLLGLHGGGERAEAAARVDRRVVAELGLDDLLIALRERRRGQDVRQQDDDDRAEHEERANTSSVEKQRPRGI